MHISSKLALLLNIQCDVRIESTKIGFRRFDPTPMWCTFFVQFYGLRQRLQFYICLHDCVPRYIFWWFIILQTLCYKIINGIAGRQTQILKRLKINLKFSIYSLVTTRKQKAVVLLLGISMQCVVSICMVRHIKHPKKWFVHIMRGGRRGVAFVRVDW